MLSSYRRGWSVSMCSLTTILSENCCDQLRPFLLPTYDQLSATITVVFRYIWTNAQRRCRETAPHHWDIGITSNHPFFISSSNNLSPTCEIDFTSLTKSNNSSRGFFKEVHYSYNPSITTSPFAQTLGPTSWSFHLPKNTFLLERSRQ